MTRLQELHDWLDADPLLALPTQMMDREQFVAWVLESVEIDASETFLTHYAEDDDECWSAVLAALKAKHGTGELV